MRSLFFIIFAILIVSCKDFQDESFTASEADARAINAFTADSLAIPLSTKLLNDYGNSSWKNSDLTSFRSSLYDSLVKDSVILEVLENAYSLRISSNNDTSYAVFSGGTSKIIIYIEEFIGIKMVNADGTTLLPDDTSIKQTTIYESLNGPTSVDHYIKSRYVFNDVPQNAIVQFLRTEQTRQSRFNLILNQ